MKARITRPKDRTMITARIISRVISTFLWFCCGVEPFLEKAIIGVPICVAGDRPRALALSEEI
jgi:hypothetical protein